jgi:hypothetical protein
MKILGELMHRRVQVKIALYPEAFEETMAKPRSERWFVLVSFPNNSALPLHEQERVLRAARREISSCLRRVRNEIDGNPSEEE